MRASLPLLPRPLALLASIFASVFLAASRSLVDILRHQSSPVQQGERNNTAVLSTTSDGRMSKALYTPVLQGKDNRSKWAQPGGGDTVPGRHPRRLPW